MRTEWFVAFAAIILIGLGAVIVIDLQSDDEPSASGSPTPTASATDDATATPTPSPDPEPEPTDTPAPSPSPSATAEPTASPTPDPTETSTPATPGQSSQEDASAVSYTAVSFSASGTRFGAAAADSRSSNFQQTCPVVPEANESFTQCRRAWSATAKRWWAVTETSSGSSRSATLWAHNGAGAFNAVRATGSYTASMTLGGPTWPNHDDVVTLDFGSTVEVLAYDTNTGPRVAAVVPIGANASWSAVAQRFTVFASGANRTTTVLALQTGSGLSGSRANLSAASDRSPEEVALTAYRAWVNNNRAAAAPWVNEAVDKALFEQTPATGGDAFALAGTSCPLADGAFTCTFTSTAGTMAWEIRPVDGVLRVVGIDSTA
ncbi:MAG: hypothetical protein R3249_04575 [Nitriliruptorales bacterium]|nr:hypothetical protein [Nitriliruptorales bacterium]